jgi:ParB family chromosome partitioning protein
LSSVKTIDLGLKGYDELFMTGKERLENDLPKIYDIPLAEIDDFPGHPYKVKLDEDMDQLVQSVKERGILTPITLREKEDGRYEVVSGHRRKKACELAGLETVRAEIKELTRDEAIILMVESNYQRSSIMPSEKAFAYKMRLEAMNRQGMRTDLTCGPMGHKSDGTKSRDIVAENTNESARQVSRYIRLTELVPPILDMVDDGKIAFRPAVELSYLTQEEQNALLETMSYEDATPSLAQAIKMKEFSRSGKLNDDVILSIMSEEKPNQREKFTFQAERLRKYIPQSVPFDKTEDYVLKALEYYQRYQQRQRDSRDSR